MCLIGCGPKEESLSIPGDVQECEDGLRIIWQNDTVPLQSHIDLQSMLPSKWGPSLTNAFKDGGIHPGYRHTFSEASLHLESSFDFYFDYVLRDYAQDSATILAIWKEFLAAGRGESPDPSVVQVRQLGGCSEAFVWEWYNGSVRSIEALLYGRYHLTLTDHTSPDDAEKAFKTLQKGWKKIPWKQWEKLGIEPILFSF
jgi:hypothetical protein